MVIASQVYQRYDRLYRLMVDAYRARIVAADPRVGSASAFHHTHNWGNDASKALLTQFARRSAALIQRGQREYRLAGGGK